MTSEAVWVGADPGGKDNFGLAIMGADGIAMTFCVDSCDDAIATVMKTVQRVAGVGIDAPLWWSSGRSSDRKADQWIRSTYRLSGGQVQGGNSLRGAALIQGALFASAMRDRFPSVVVTEAHPKALLRALRLDSWRAAAERFGITSSIKETQEHERDAIIAAVAAREGFIGRWSRDLSADRHKSEQDPQRYWLAPVNYFWPAEHEGLAGSDGRPPEIERLLSRLRDDGRSSPSGSAWQTFFAFLRARKLPSAGDPPVPLILAAAGESNGSKLLRLGAQLEWASANNCLADALAHLETIPEDSWNRGASETWHQDAY